MKIITSENRCQLKKNHEENFFSLKNQEKKRKKKKKKEKKKEKEENRVYNSIFVYY